MKDSHETSRTFETKVPKPGGCKEVFYARRAQTGYIFFADVTGSTALADTLDPEDMRALMSRYYDHSRRLITPRGGILEKFIGDAVMAIFGLYRMHEDDPVRALTAALALREAVANDEILSPVFRLRIGVNTGEW